MTSELERIKILESKVTQVVDYINKLLKENEKLKQQIKELKTEKKDFEDQVKRTEKLDEDLKRYAQDRKIMKEKIETILDQIDQVGI
ncbi:MAG: cell division protein ZapB [Candidatus Aminicenantes bacterium]|nr:cell division protein ZapB [Candidatus Aminicenantes bacterium]MQY60431.1 cell division protein ZapB [bacterium]TES86473.1 MAG: cell division protein ZapB [Candidatus Aminicenantes bacterium]